MNRGGISVLDLAYDEAANLKDVIRLLSVGSQTTWIQMEKSNISITLYLISAGINLRPGFPK